MRILIKPIIIIIIYLSLLVQTGCWDQKLYEEIGFILQLGLETDKDGSLLLSVTSPVIAPEAKANVEFLNISSERLIRSSREKLRNVSGKQLQGGKIQQVYFSKELAKKGGSEFLEVFLREPENPLLANVIVVDGSPKEMMEYSIEFKDKPRLAFYVNELLRDARRRFAVPETRVYNFSIAKYSKSIDPVTPMLRYNKKNIEITGSALFNRDKMVGEIDTKQTMLLNTFLEKGGRFQYIYEGQLPEDTEDSVKRGAALSIKSSKPKININTSDSVPVIDISFSFKASVDEITGTHKLDKEENKKKLEEIFAKSLQDDSLKLLKYLQNVGSDPIGFGEIVRSKHNEYWNSVNWKTVYKNAVFNVDVKMNLESYGNIT